MRTIKSLLLTSSMAMASIAAAESQVPYAAANGNTSIAALRNGFLGIDMSAMKIGATWIGPLGAACRDDCELPHLQAAIHASAAARGGQTSLFSDVEFTTEFQGGGRLMYVLDRPGSAYNVVLLGASFATLERRVVEFGPAESDTSLTEPRQQTATATLGFNHGMGNGTAFGIGFDVRREWGTPGVTAKREVCRTGLLFAGGTIGAPICSNRYVGPLPNEWSAQIRGDVALRLFRFGAEASRPTIALLGGASWDIRQSVSGETNVAVGAGLQPAGYRGHLLATILVELADVFSSNDPTRSLSDGFALRAFVSVPFPLFVGAGGSG